jgi:hypothetical protein
MFEMPICITSCECTLVICERNIDLLCITHEKACSNVCVLPNALAKFLANLHSSENRNTGKEAYKVIKASWLKLLHKTDQYCSSLNLSFSFSGASLTSVRNGVSKICICVAWL